ncbi:flagellar basal body P-ring formation chaperone FlgA [Paracoccus sp. P2]|uniref:Flagella basal body P-ring formation protein FlgA n=1 Tax=Paracoccus pantotrophus TaxID=82367 RepID=A0A7H9C011_PARPN|nr:flagellar basal body P-ring formation chaperone FlgA [Paracoccus pantotrophus]MDF3856309.1 flagellar basal body P-ring formation chaperone FlgA [Paracoccus pantotrophus]QLH15431.1 flagellar basal body P-ring formation protein FlgA [Paracoccus pantotrophus]RNI20381.1 flagella basal body P-ring formation protein FlgA [Paracoccus pantotrophus]SFP06971.1 flagella basal body P-ring formation protein FlgA [Paracoccus pantotrophus]
MRGLVLLLMLLPQGTLAGSVVANRTLPAGTVIAAGDVSLVPDQPGGIEEIAAVLGQQLRVMVYQGRRIAPSTLTAPTLVGRNQIVTIAYEKAALRIEAEGRALSAGSAGQVIRVMNNASRVTVSGRVAADGTVIVRQN